MDQTVPDQAAMWDEIHGRDSKQSLRDKPNPFAVLAEASFPREAKVLELGCGAGGDAKYFASKGHQVAATDFSSVVIKQNQKQLSNTGIDFQILNITDDWPFDGETFDVVYANLSLHYYSDADTRKIFKKVWQVLKPAGLLAFACKSVNDQHFHRGGQELEPNFFVSAKGHVRHFFSEDYAKDVLDRSFKIIKLEEVIEEYSGDVSHIIRCIAEKA